MPDTLRNISAGRLRQRVRLQRPVTTRGSANEPITRFEDDFSAWAEVLPQTGREPIVAQRLEEEITHLISFRARPDKRVTAEWEIAWLDTNGGVSTERYFAIDHILNLAEHGAVLQARCVERPRRPETPLEEVPGGPNP